MNVTYTEALVDIEQQFEVFKLERLRHMVRVIDFMTRLERASGYENFDAQAWQERAHSLRITRADMVEYRESEARIARGKALPF